MKPNFLWLCKNPICLLAFGFGSGLSPKAPGTVGTLVAIPLSLLWLIFGFPVWSLIIWGIVLFPIGVFICNYTERKLGVHDYGGIVFDEIGAMIMILGIVPFEWLWWLIAFALFRFFDALKPFPINWFDKRVEGGLGVMLDDYIAGFLCMAILYLISFAV